MAAHDVWKQLLCTELLKGHWSKKYKKKESDVKKKAFLLKYKI